MANSSTGAEPESRYTRVKAILEAAAGDSPSDYGGVGRFWDLPLDAFLEARVYGVRLVRRSHRHPAAATGKAAVPAPV